MYNLWKFINEIFPLLLLKEIHGEILCKFFIIGNSINIKIKTQSILRVFLEHFKIIAENEAINFKKLYFNPTNPKRNLVSVFRKRRFHN